MADKALRALVGHGSVRQRIFTAGRYLAEIDAESRDRLDAGTRHALDALHAPKGSDDEFAEILAQAIGGILEDWGAYQATSTRMQSERAET